MNRQCCRFSTTTASILPGVVLAVMPKCPLCLAVWLTAATSIGFSATAAAWLRGGLAALWVVALAYVGRALACAVLQLRRTRS
jgi:hypothetical protein